MLGVRGRLEARNALRHQEMGADCLGGKAELLPRMHRVIKEEGNY